ncbi:MAG: hydrolase [Methylomonas sp.]|jgi:nicotinamidase-related amidase
MMTQPHLLDSRRCLVLIIDIQTRLAAAMPENDAAVMTANVCKLLQAAEIFNVPVLLTEQYPQGLGPTMADICRHLPADVRIFSKTSFSCCGAENFNQVLLSSKCRQVILCGQEAHVCVLQTAIDLIQLGLQVYVVEDAVCSRRPEHKHNAMQRMSRQGVTPVCLESVLFEWLKDAKHADFKAVSALVR